MDMPAVDIGTLPGGVLVNDMPLFGATGDVSYGDTYSHVPGSAALAGFGYSYGGLNAWITGELGAAGWITTNRGKRRLRRVHKGNEDGPRIRR
jgi:hypothetical protein